jgi:hypothetical protein
MALIFLSRHRAGNRIFRMRFGQREMPHSATNRKPGGLKPRPRIFPRTLLLL